MPAEGWCPACDESIEYGERDFASDYSFMRHHVKCTNPDCTFSGWEVYYLTYQETETEDFETIGEDVAVTKEDYTAYTPEVPDIEFEEEED